MKRRIAAGLSILVVAASLGWRLASHPETSPGLAEISLDQHSEHSRPGATEAWARVRVRVMPDELGDEIRAAADQVPQISLAAE